MQMHPVYSHLGCICQLPHIRDQWPMLAPPSGSHYLPLPVWELWSSRPLLFARRFCSSGTYLASFGYKHPVNYAAFYDSVPHGRHYNGWYHTHPHTHTNTPTHLPLWTPCPWLDIGQDLGVQMSAGWQTRLVDDWWPLTLVLNMLATLWNVGQVHVNKVYPALRGSFMFPLHPIWSASQSLPLWPIYWYSPEIIKPLQPHMKQLFFYQ